MKFVLPICAVLTLIKATYAMAALGGTAMDISQYNRLAKPPSIGACQMYLITDTIGITAAHCVYGSQPDQSGLYNGGGILGIDPGSDREFENPSPAKKIVIHPQYSGNSWKLTLNFPFGPFGDVKEHDIAVVELAEPAESYLNGVPLVGPKATLPDRPLSEDDTVFLLSLGGDGSKPLMKVDLNFKGAAGWVSSVDMFVTKNDDSFICPGDSGGPVFRQLPNGDLQLVALVSSGFSNKTPSGLFIHRFVGRTIFRKHS